MKRKGLVSLLLVTSLLAPIAPNVAHADGNPILGTSTTTPHKVNNGSVYWTTSNLREWLNSDLSNVNYTNNPPTYKNEVGFLNGFSESERDAIAVTERKSFVHSNDGSIARDGGTTNVTRHDGAVATPYIQYMAIGINKNMNSVFYQKLNDKVFLLQPNELYEYVQKRGISYKKGLSPEAKKLFNISSATSDWTSTYLRSDVWSENLIRLNSEGKANEVSTSTTNLGVVPAMHIKPSYTLSNGKKASELKIGDIVEFGKYLNAPIKWDVINITADGYPLLWSSNIVSLKRYDAQGDFSYRYSTAINFPSHDVSILNGLQYRNDNGDTQEPSMKVVNETDLSTMQNSAWTVHVEASDVGSGVDRIILPDGSTVKGNKASYPIDENGYYYFEAIDKAGNHFGYSVPVGNMNPPAKVLIETSSDVWTNKDVQVTIKPSNEGVGWTPDTTTTSGTGVGGGTWSSYSTYANKRVKATGYVRLVSSTKEAGNYTAGLRIDYDRRTKSGDDYHVGRNYPTIAQVNISELEDGKKHYMEGVFTIGGDYFGKISPTLRRSGSNVENGWFTLEYSDVKYELLDQEDFGIDKIILPSGEMVTANGYTDTLSKDGTYEYEVIDSRGMVTKKTVVVKVDKNAPTLTITPNTNEVVHDSVVLSVKGSDTQSGVKRIQQPNGEWVSGNSLNYNVYDNGDYKFVIEDVAGNTSTKTIKVSNIDKSIKFEHPEVSSARGSIELGDTPKSVYANVGAMKVKDWRDNKNNWRVTVSASAPILEGSNHKLPSGSVKLKSPSVTRDLGSGNSAKTSFSDSKVIDSGSVSVVEGSGSRGEYTVTFPTNALEFVADATTAKPGKYKSTLTWELVQAP